MSPQWWESHPSAEVRLFCSGGEHRLRWERGELRALDHPDPQGERALAALGGETYPCITVLEAWERHRDDLRVLILASRGPGDVIHSAMHRFGWSRSGPMASGMTLGNHPRPVARSHVAVGMGGLNSRVLTRAVPVIGMPQPEDDEVISLLSTSGALWDRLVATVLGIWSERLDADDPRCQDAFPALAAALYGRVALAVRTWVGDPDLDVAVDMVSSATEPSLTREPDRAVVRLPFRWLSDVWSSGVVVVLGRLAVRLLESNEMVQRIETVGPEFGDVRIVAIRLEDPTPVLTERDGHRSHF